MNLIVVDETAQDKILRAMVMEANKKENWLDMTNLDSRDDSKFKRNVILKDPHSGVMVELQVIYTVTTVDGRPCRHCTMNRVDYRGPPDPLLAITVLMYIGFKGGMADWNIGPCCDEHTNDIVATQPFSDEERLNLH